MSWTHEVFARTECTVPIRTTIASAIALARTANLDAGFDEGEILLEFRNIKTNNLVSEAAICNTWSWPTDCYLWISSTTNKKSGVDIELRAADPLNDRMFLDADMRSKGVDAGRIASVVERASGIVYSFRSAFFQDKRAYMLMLLVEAALANDCDGWIYTLDADLVGTLAPLSALAMYDLLKQIGTGAETEMQLEP